ncbi:ankyrin repeat domain-containing protein 16-like isoform X3 [Haemaphysalis longicornis]
MACGSKLEANYKLLEYAQHDDVESILLVLGRECGDDVQKCAQCLKNVKYEKSGDTLAHVASRYGSLDVLGYLAKEVRGLLESRNLDGKTPLHEAAQSSELGVVQFLLGEGCHIDPLKRADWEGHADITSYLLDVCPDAWNNRSKNKRTPLHTAALHGHLECVKLLLLRGGDPPDLADNCGTTPFMDAAQADQSAVMDYLVQFHKVDMTRVDVLGNSSLHLASQAGALSAIRSLVNRYGVDVNSVNSWGQTALHLAAKVGQHDAIRLLISLGAKCSAMDNKGRTARDLAKDGSYHSCCSLLEAHEGTRQ